MHSCMKVTKQNPNNKTIKNWNDFSVMRSKWKHTFPTIWSKKNMYNIFVFYVVYNRLIKPLNCIYSSNNVIVDTLVVNCSCTLRDSLYLLRVHACIRCAYFTVRDWLDIFLPATFLRNAYILKNKNNGDCVFLYNKKSAPVLYIIQ